MPFRCEPDGAYWDGRHPSGVWPWAGSAATRLLQEVDFSWCRLSPFILELTECTFLRLSNLWVLQKAMSFGVPYTMTEASQAGG
jgi:hypothetical protein